MGLSNLPKVTKAVCGGAGKWSGVVESHSSALTS